MNNNCLDVSVVIPLFNHEKYIVDALSSVYKQTVKVKEVIVVDDGSSDYSFKIVKDYFGNESNLILSTKPNAGAHHTINAGIYKATSKYVSILNSDDFYDPNRIEVLYKTLETNEDIDLVATRARYIDQDNNFIFSNWYENALNFYKDSGDIELALINSNFILTTSNFFIRKSVFEIVGYFENFRYAHDLAFLLKLLSNNRRIYYEEKELLSYRMHDNNTINECHLKVKHEVAFILGNYLFDIALNKKGINWKKFLKIQEVLDKHDLSKPVLAVLLNRENEMNKTHRVIPLGTKFLNYMRQLIK